MFMLRFMNCVSFKILDGAGEFRALQDPLHSHEFRDAGSVILVRVGPRRDAANVALLQQEIEDPG